MESVLAEVLPPRLWASTSPPVDRCRGRTKSNLEACCVKCLCGMFELRTWFACSLRTKKHAEKFGQKTDKEIFDELPCGDVWDDANLIRVFMYLYNMESTSVPTTWQASMASFKQELEEFAVDPCLLQAYQAARRRRYVTRQNHASSMFDWC